jgi:hypothetical protein
MNSVSEYLQTWPGLDDKEAQKEKNVDPQTRNDVMETDTPTKNTQTNEKKEDTMEPQHTGAAEQDAKDWAQLIQEEEDGCSTMMVEDDNSEKSTPRETAPTRGTGKTPGEAVSADILATPISRPKNLKLETGSELRTDRHRSITRQVVNQQDTYEHTT